jgi:LysR family hydrogen peroxide-inducible transcriptional activator
MPNLRQLEYLVALSETLHFRQAAERANTTQPTLSEQLKALETRLGAKLVERTNKQVLMTPLGEMVVKIAKQMLRDAEEIRVLASHSNSGLAGVMKLAIPPTIAPYFLPQIIPILKQTYPELRLYIREVKPNVILHRLQEGKADMAISLLPINQKDLCSEFMFNDPLHLIVSKNHHLAEKKSVNMSELLGEDVLALEAGHQLHETVRSISEKAGLRLRTDYEGTSLDTLRGMVAMNLGITFLPGLYVKAAVNSDPNLTEVTLEGTPLFRQIGLIWRQSSPYEKPLKELAKTLKDKITED